MAAVLEPEDRTTIWDMREAGVPVKRIARHLGRQNSSLRRFIADAGGRRPTPRERSELRLSLAEREEISRGLAAGWSIRAIAAGTGPCAVDGLPGGQRQRRSSALSGPARRSGGGPAGAATQAHQAGPVPSPASGRSRRKLEDNWSPEQISSWLADAHPDDPEMQVSHETIYQSLFVQGKGALRKELHACLRSGRAMRRAKAYTKASHVGPGQAQRHGDDLRAPRRGGRPGGARPLGGRPHLRQEDDLHRHLGRAPQPLRHVVQAAPTDTGPRPCASPWPNGSSPCRRNLRRSLTWDQGKEMAEHVRFSVDTGVAGLLLRPEEPLATWHQREHQRPVAPIPAEERRPVLVLTAAAQRHRTFTQPTPSTDTRLDDTISGVRRGRCVDPLRTHRDGDTRQRLDRRPVIAPSRDISITLGVRGIARPGLIDR